MESYIIESFKSIVMIFVAIVLTIILMIGWVKSKRLRRILFFKHLNIGGGKRVYLGMVFYIIFLMLGSLFTIYVVFWMSRYLRPELNIFDNKIISMLPSVDVVDLIVKDLDLVNQVTLFVHFLVIPLIFMWAWGRFKNLAPYKGMFF